MITFVRASRELMDEVRMIINSNYDLYKDIVNPIDLPEHWVDDAWAERNFAIREFYLAHNDDPKQYVGTASYQNLGNFAYIGYFYIQRTFHRQKLGQSLMKFIEMRTILDHLTDLRLFCNPKSTWALNFYLKLGFKVFTSSKNDILAMDNGVMQPFYEQEALFLQKQSKK
ncbi:MAG: Acetyltransferase, GNAT family [Promethearchaeota archaeon CR_4]|nr:MAG: Acetyltransferase, GNAT family [Candidatus Lokiarchaeota archaeon CR_4]